MFVVEFLLNAGTVVSVLILCLWALTQLRDEAVGNGWFSVDGVLGRMSVRAARARLKPLLQAVGIEDEDASAMRRQRSIRRAGGSSNVGDRPDHELLRRVKPWTRELMPPYEFRGARYYVDTMGAVHHRQDFEPSLAQILQKWVAELQSANAIADFDALLTPKEGNPVLTYDLCRTVMKSKAMLLCKGTDDPARVEGPNPGPHPLDFEGLDSFIERSRPLGRKVRVLAIDDSCTSGRTISNAASRFNELIRQDPELTALIEPVTDVVVLFRVLSAKPPPLADKALQQAGLKLHALVSLGPTEMKELIETSDRKLDKLVDRFKTDKWGCRESRRIFST